MDAGGFDITALDELGFNDAAANASATRRIRWNGTWPTFHDGVSARGLGTKIIRKTADETVNNSSTLQNDDTLLYALAASEVVTFVCSVHYDGATTPDIQFAFTVPAAATLRWGVAGAFEDTAANNVNTGVTVSGTSIAVATAGAGSAEHLLLVGVVANGANAGNLQLQWAQNTATASDTIVRANSFLMIVRV